MYYLQITDVQKIWRPFGDRIPIDLHLGKEIDPPYPLVYRWRHSICFCLDGSTPLEVPAKKSKKWFAFQKWGPKMEIGGL